MSAAVVILGAGHAGVQAAASLREEGFDGDIALLSDEKELPYQRPPLSKAYPKGEMDVHGLPLRAEAFFAEHRIDLRLGVRATRIDRAEKRVATSDGGIIPYSHLILATGSRHRPLDIPGIGLPGVLVLRTIADALALREAMGEARKDRDHRGRFHRPGDRGDRVVAWPRRRPGRDRATDGTRGVRASVGILCSRPPRVRRQSAARNCRDGHRGQRSGRRRRAQRREVLAADLVVVGVGALAEDALSRPRGWARMRQRRRSVRRASDLGPGYFRDWRLRKLSQCGAWLPHSARNQCRTQSTRRAWSRARLAGKPSQAYDALPWFWSDQGDLKLQIAGLSHGVATSGSCAANRKRAPSRSLGSDKAGLPLSRPSIVSATMPRRGASSGRRRP